MNVIWYDHFMKNNPAMDLNHKNLAYKCLNYSEDNDALTINVICQDKQNKELIVDAFNGLHDKFEGIQLRLAWMEKEGFNMLEGMERESIFIGDQQYCKSFENVFNRKACIISNRAIENKTCIAYQRHLNTHNNPHSIALGEIKSDLSKAEALLRRAEGIFFNLDSIRRQESFVSESSVTGLNLHESCSLIRSAGMAMNNKLVLFNFGSEQLNKDRSEVIALLIWYYLEGLISQKIEKIEHNNNKLYMVSSPYFDKPVKFIKGNITGRWWYQHPDTLYYVPCTEDDYLEMSKGKITNDFLLDVHVD